MELLAYSAISLLFTKYFTPIQLPKEWLIEECKILIRESLLNTYPEVFKPKDFKPKENLLKFKF